MTTKDNTPDSKRPKKNSAGYLEILHQARTHMSMPAKLFSHFIHFRPIEILSDFLAITIFRPIPIIFAGISAAALPLVIWIAAKYFGYSLSGTESIVAFILGWLIGYIVDYTKVLVTGKSAN